MRETRASFVVAVLVNKQPKKDYIYLAVCAKMMALL